MAKRKPNGGNYYGPNAADQLHEPPPLSFSPSLTYERLASERGTEDTLFDLRRENKYERQDIGTQRRLTKRGAGRTKSDIRRERGLALFDLGRSATRGNEDIGLQRTELGTEFTRTLGDLALARTRGEEDYTRALGDLSRQYSQLAERQNDAVAAAGASAGGAGAESARRRAENQAYEKTDIDQSRQRRLEDLAQSESRTREDYGSASGRLDLASTRLGEDYSTGTERTLEDARLGLRRTDQDLHSDLSALARARQRGQATRKTERQRAIREGTFADVGLRSESIFQAQQLEPGIYNRYGRKKKGQ